MSQIVSGNTDALAAEYVLGTLDPEERTQAQALLTIDQEFVAKVQLWERRLGELHLMVEPVEPDGKIWDRIKAKMPDIKPVLEIAPAPPEIPQPAPSPEVPEAKSPSLGLDAAPAAAKDETPTPVPRPTPNSVPTPASPPSLGPAPNLAASPTPNPALSSASPPVPSPPPIPATTPPAPASVTPMPSPVEAPKPIAAPVLTPFGRLAPEPEPKKGGSAVVQGRLSRWRAFALLMTLLVLAVAALLAAWRFVPERLPPMLQPAELMRHLGITSTGPPARKPAPPESQYDE